MNPIGLASYLKDLVSPLVQSVHRFMKQQMCAKEVNLGIASRNKSLKHVVCSQECGEECNKDHLCCRCK